MSSFGRTRATTAEAALSDLPEGWNSVKFVSGSAAVAIAMSGNPQAWSDGALCQDRLVGQDMATAARAIGLDPGGVAMQERFAVMPAERRVGLLDPGHAGGCARG